jgi:hypothetical protein
MRNERRHELWYIPKKELQNILSRNTTLADALREVVGVSKLTYAYEILKVRIEEDDLDISHLDLNDRHSGRRNVLPTNEEIFVENSQAHNTIVKRRLIKDNLIPYVCAECHNDGIWNGIKLVLQLDHVNGINNDNRLVNLRFLCPNCHSQTGTYSGRNR